PLGRFPHRRRALVQRGAEGRRASVKGALCDRHRAQAAAAGPIAGSPVRENAASPGGSRARALQHLVRALAALGTRPRHASDHPYVTEHPDWFRARPDGTIQYAENPPKKYQDIYPFDFESKDWRGLWAELKSIFEFWIGHGVTIFRVDNPHTKAFAFWEWCID